MADEKNREEQEKGFVVKDRRFSAKKEGEEAPQKPKAEATEETPKGQEAVGEEPLPEINFTSLIFSLTTSALIQMGEIQDPTGKEPGRNLPLAKQTIDLIGMLKEKTKGNLNSEEEKFMDNVLYDLKMRYVKALG